MLEPLRVAGFGSVPRLTVLLLLLVCACPSVCAQVESVLPQAASNTVFFYSPETSINNYRALKGEFDAYLADKGGYRFQPCSGRVDFERIMHDDGMGYFLMSSWHYRQTCKPSDWDPVLVGVCRGESVQRHSVYSKKEIANLESLKGATIATAATPEYSRLLVRRVLGEDPGGLVDSFKFLVVPKDIDALMAVSFGVADGAIATGRGAEKLARTNPKQREELKALTHCADSLLPILVVKSETGDSAARLAPIFQTMGNTVPGRQRLKMLGLDGFVKITPEQKMELEGK